MICSYSGIIIQKGGISNMKSVKVILSLVLACSIIFVPLLSGKTSNVFEVQTVSAKSKYPTKWQALPRYTHVKVITIKQGTTEKAARNGVITGLARAIDLVEETGAALTKAGFKTVMRATAIGFIATLVVEDKIEKDQKIYVKVTAKYRQITEPKFDENGNIRSDYLEVEYTMTTYKDKAMKKKISSSTKREKAGTPPMW